MKQLLIALAVGVFIGFLLSGGSNKTAHLDVTQEEDKSENYRPDRR